jgi:hypothetical protein
VEAPCLFGDGERRREMEGGIKGTKMVITIDVGDPTKYTVTNEKDEEVKPASVNTLQKDPINGVYHVNSAAILGKRESPDCVILEIFGRLYEI